MTFSATPSDAMTDWFPGPVLHVEAWLRFYAHRVGFTENHSMAPRLARR